MIKSSESIDDNIVEGCGTATNAEFASFLNMAIRSATGFEGQIERARDYGILPRKIWQQYATEVIDIRKMASSLHLCALRAPDGRIPDDAFTDDELTKNDPPTNGSTDSGNTDNGSNGL